MSSRIVVIGGGISAKGAATALAKRKNTDVTLVQANPFVEWALAMPVCLVKPERHIEVLSSDPQKFQVPGVTYKYGVVESVDTAAKEVKLNRESVPYDALVVATGFRMPLVYPAIGTTLDERMKEVQSVGDAIKNASCVVVNGGGAVGLELAGNIRINHPGEKRVVLLCRRGVCSERTDSERQKIAAQLKQMNIEVVEGESDAPMEYSLAPGKITCGTQEVQYDVYFPAFSQGPNTKFLSECQGVLDSKGRVDVNEFLQSKQHPEIFAVGVSNVPEPIIVIPKLEAQWTSVAQNISALLDGNSLKAHKEGAPFMKLPAMVVIGHGPQGYAYIDFNNVPPPLKACCCGGLGGWPCCPPCWPCCGCMGCGCCPCGYCCGPPAGTGPATLAGKLPFMFAKKQFNGMGEKPLQESMK